jgi:hypothetical protein
LATVVAEQAGLTDVYEAAVHFSKISQDALDRLARFVLEKYAANKPRPLIFGSGLAFYNDWTLL